MRPVALTCCTVLIQPALPSIQKMEDGRMWGGLRGGQPLSPLTYPMGFLFLLGSCGIWLYSSLWAVRSSLSFNPPTLHSLLSDSVFIKFCLTTGRLEKNCIRKASSVSCLCLHCYNACADLSALRQSHDFVRVLYLRIHSFVRQPSIVTESSF